MSNVGLRGLQRSLSDQNHKPKQKLLFHKKTLYWLAIPLLLLVAAVSGGIASAASVTPSYVAGNPTCTELGYSFGFKPTSPSESNPVGTHTVPGGTITVTKSGEAISWTSTIGIDAVIVKGGPNANLYAYDPPAESFGDTNLVSPTNPNNGSPYGLSHVEFCYDFNLGVSKTAVTSFTRDYDWTIQKSVDQQSLNLSTGQQYDLNYTVVVTKDAGTDSGWSVSGVITVSNPHPTVAANGVIVTDSISGGIGSVPVTCPSTTIAANSSMNCTYGPVALPDGTSRVNTATATTTTTAIASGTGTAGVTFGSPTTVQDDCVAVSDSLQGVLSASQCSSQTFNYTRTVYADLLACGENTINNIASLVSDDGNTETSNASVTVNVACVLGCTLTQGYWKTHSEGRKYDSAWALVGGPNAPFYASSMTWIQVFNTPPAGNPYYQLAHQYMAAKLNVLNGASAPAAVTNALAATNTLFTGLNPNTSFTKTQKATMLALASTLGSYNEGLTGPGHCSE